MATEDQVPLPTDNSHIRDLSSSMIPDSSLAYDTSVYLEDAVFSAYDADRVKLLISEYGSVSTMIYMDNSGKYYCPDTAASCYPFDGVVNHAVTLIGWDDNYKKENFSSNSDVTTDGAWIVKNSYGTSWGDDGYFYISYEDKSLKNLVSDTAVTTPAIRIITFMTESLPVPPAFLSRPVTLLPIFLSQKPEMEAMKNSVRS